MHILHLRKYLGGLVAECRFQQPAIGHAFLQRVGHRARLLEDFLQHVVRIGAFFRRLCRQFTLPQRALRAVAVGIEDAHAAAPHFGDVALFQKLELPRHGQQR